METDQSTVQRIVGENHPAALLIQQWSAVCRALRVGSVELPRLTASPCVRITTISFGLAVLHTLKKEYRHRLDWWTAHHPVSCTGTLARTCIWLCPSIQSTPHRANDLHNVKNLKRTSSTESSLHHSGFLPRLIEGFIVILGVDINQTLTERIVVSSLRSFLYIAPVPGLDNEIWHHSQLDTNGRSVGTAGSLRCADRSEDSKWRSVLCQWCSWLSVTWICSTFCCLRWAIHLRPSISSLNHTLVWHVDYGCSPFVI